MPDAVVKVFTLKGLPLTIYLERKKVAVKMQFPCNLNRYRNAHFQVLNKVKEVYHRQVASLLKEQNIGPVDGRYAPFHLEYRLWAGTKRAFDLNNVVTVVDKFTCDALVECGIIPDDNVKYISSITSRFMGIDRDGARIEITLYRQDRAADSIHLPGGGVDLELGNDDLPMPSKSMFL